MDRAPGATFAVTLGVTKRACAAAGLPFVRLREADGYFEAELAQRVQFAIDALRPPALAPAPAPAPEEIQHSLSTSPLTTMTSRRCGGGALDCTPALLRRSIRGDNPPPLNSR
ncbi:hypothetical protein [uncultured Thiodictyon sp.]|uniref:hypothetical protein n=1 Tax=uncultured Thiodictyon sp. TaxID=1846217 RepID=UPI0025E43D8F|nr:hypothetical protein [uncultured Thiodictyon sp.]